MILRTMRVDPDVEAQLLCEGCGYRLEGLGSGVACPECGRLAELSDPARRAGSAWQRGMGLSGWWRTTIGLIREPRAFWERVRPDQRSGRDLAFINAAVTASLVLGIPVATRLSGELFYALLWMIAFGAVWTMTLAEQFGVRFWGNVHGGRVTKAIAWSVCGHASAGWTLGGLLAGGGWALGRALGDPRLFTIDVSWHYQDVGLALALFVCGAVIGMFVFETLTYIGVRRMRFVNAPRV